MATTRTYGDGCAIARGLDAVGDRWALLIVRELLLGPKRFTGLRKGLPNASPNVLSERLRALEASGIVSRAKLPPPASAQVYELTEWGRDLEGVVLALGRWASRSPSPIDPGPIGSDSVALALRGLFDPAAAEGLRARYELRLGEDRFRVEIADGALTVARGGDDAAEASIETDPDTFSALLWGGLRLAEARSAGAIRIDGDRGAAERLLGLFSLPEPARAS